jgi:signal transduction histidine kinase
VRETSESRWEQRLQALVGWCAYGTLAISTILYLLAPARSTVEQLITLVLVAVAAVWVYLLFTRTLKPRREHRLRMLVFFVGLLVIASALMLRHPLFFVFMISGFFYASELRPLPLAVVGVAATSILINTLIAGLPTTPDAWTFYLTIIGIQTLAIGFGTVVGEKISEASEQRKQVVAQLEAALRENEGLHAQLVTQAREAGVLDERGRMAREIHDTIAHGLTGIITQLEAAAQAMDRPADHQRHLDNALRLARESLDEARRSVEASRPEALEHADLPGALSRVASEWSSIQGITVAVTTTGEPMPLHPEIETALLRTAQEALANVARHAHATRVGVTLSYMGDVVTLDVRDDGVGFDVGDEAKPAGGGGFGLTAMRQRVSRVAGTLAIESEPGVGTAVSARVPAISAQPAARAS